VKTNPRRATSHSLNTRWSQATQTKKISAVAKKLREVKADEKEGLIILEFLGLRIWVKVTLMEMFAVLKVFWTFPSWDEFIPRHLLCFNLLVSSEF